MKKIEAVIFDFSGVIVTRIGGIGKILEPLLHKEKKKIHSEFKIRYFKDFLVGKITEEEYWSKIIKENKWDINVKKLKEASRKNFIRINGTIKIIKELKENRIKLGLLSAHTKEWIYFLRKKYDYEKYFDAALYSYEAGYTKPERKFYKDIAKKLNVTADHCIYIDDKEKFLKPAKEVGMNIILFKSPEQLKKELNNYFESHINL